MYSGFEKKIIYLNSKDVLSKNVFESAQKLLDEGIYAFEIYDGCEKLMLSVDGFNNKCGGKFTKNDPNTGMNEWEIYCNANKPWKEFEDKWTIDGDLLTEEAIEYFGLSGELDEEEI